MSLEMAAMGAAASLSLADVDYNKKKEEKEGSQCTFVGLLTLLLAGGSATLSVFSMALYGGASLAAGVVALLITPIVLIQRFHLNKMATFREVHNALRQDINLMNMENDDLERQTNRLQEKAGRVEEVELNLEKILSRQGGSVDSFCRLVKENGVLQSEMEALLVAEVAQQLASAVVRADRNADGQITDAEVDALFFQIKAIRGVQGIDEEKLRAMLQSGSQKNAIEGVMDTIRDMMNSTTMGKPSQGLIQVSSPPAAV